MNVRETGTKLTSPSISDATCNSVSLGFYSSSSILNNKVTNSKSSSCIKKETGGKNLNNNKNNQNSKNKSSTANKNVLNKANSALNKSEIQPNKNLTTSLVDHSKSGVSCDNANSSSTKSSKNSSKNKTKNTNSSSRDSIDCIANSSEITKEEKNKVRKKANNKKLKKEKFKIEVKKENSKLDQKVNLESKIEFDCQQFDQQQKYSDTNNQQLDLTTSNYYQQIDSTFFDGQTIINNTSMNSTSPSTTNQDGWYLKEIQNMMHGFGDSPNPNEESVRLVEQIVHQQVTCLLRLAGDIAIQRQSKQIGLEDFLFLLRKDKIKLCRLLRHFNLKDMRNRMSSEEWIIENQTTSTLDESGTLDAGCTLDFDEEELLNALISEQKQPNQTQNDSFYSVKQITQQTETIQNLPTTAQNKATIFPQPAKRLKLCLDFLASIDQTGELDRYLHEDQFFDELKHNRMMRIEKITRFMSEKEYLNFYKARQTSFSNRLQPNKFRDWLYNVPHNQLDTNEWPIKPNALAIEILQYFAYETVAIIVDLALLVKQDQQKYLSDPVSKLISMNSHSDSFPLLNSNGNLSFSGSTNQVNYPSSSLNTFGITNNTSTNVAQTNKTSTNLTRNGVSFNHQDNCQSTTTLPSPFIFSSANVNTQTDCPFFSIKPQEIREVIRRYMNCNPKGSLSSVFLFGIEQWDQPNISRSKIMCL